MRRRVTRGYGNVYFRSKPVLSVPSYIYSLRCFQTKRTILSAYIAFIFIRILTGIYIVYRSTRPKSEINKIKMDQAGRLHCLQQESEEVHTEIAGERTVRDERLGLDLLFCYKPLPGRVG